MQQPRERRFIVKNPVSFEGEFGAGRGTTINLSLHGCALESGSDVKVDSTIKMDLHIPTDKKSVAVGRARVIWTAGRDVGVEFLNMSDTGRVRLEHYIGQMQNSPGKDKA